MKILVTGAAGFIGSHLCERLLSQGHSVTGIDNFDSFYPRALKEANLKTILPDNAFDFIEGDICADTTWDVLELVQFDAIIHLAAKAGVRPSLALAADYNHTNIVGTTRVLEYARKNGMPKVLFASSSSVYGSNNQLPWSVEDETLKPISIYALSKLVGEQLCSFYTQHYKLKVTALRFFSVYGPRQRPDLAIHKFVSKLYKGETIQLYGNGQTYRDYTFIDDIVDGIIGSLYYDNDGFEVFNLGNTQTVSLLDLVQHIEAATGRKADIAYTHAQEGDAPYTWSDIQKSRELLGYQPATDITDGIMQFISWYLKTMPATERDNHHEFERVQHKKPEMAY